VDAFLIKRNDTLPAIEAVLSDDSGPISLAGATVYFTMRREEDGDCGSMPTVGGPLFKKVGVVVGDQSVGSPTRGKVRYEWSAGDTATAGSYGGEFEVRFGGGGVWSFPSAGTIPVIINGDVG
jgi:hypothetical protein